jgi:predicted MFS family arabinose efflux permease
MLPSTFARILGQTTDDPAPYRLALSSCIVLGVAGVIPLTRLGSLEPCGPPTGTDEEVGTAPRQEEVSESTALPASRRAVPALIPLLGLLLCGYLNHIGFAGGKAFYSAYMDQRLGMATSLIGSVSSLGLVLSIVGAAVSPRFAAKRSSGALMLVGSAGYGGSLLLMASGHWVGAFLGVIAISALPCIWLPAYQRLQMEIAPASGRMLVAGLGSMAMSLGFATASFGGGYVVAAVGYTRLFLIGATSAVLSATLMGILLRRRVFVSPAG